ncbi:malic enzyme, NAD binding domain protein [Bifidobacterium actinocoloniiforme DSM 22766]|uniref:Malic enzyme, NAD binding domain protein n=1 Tax=Bifidobacterium actinocoloniiforme DSM 22766 TaxID=1437605 RepID=A0A086YYM7_9BIFI|nr:NADP-dependent malic enzyme [Bifidobacterium actinocoloniiforme]AKV55901.1 malate dehydrogenase [Bifidobacterium actinocoloniiforme DSM 22766]KFI39377.1 malic enzyme, NAD binding domain protein [Bifidobacterium actinocoloniiforme DSM 22766]
MGNEQEIFEMHERHRGVLGIEAEYDVRGKEELGKLYTPGVALISRAIAKDPELRHRYTMSGKLVALITDGSAVLGLGDIGPSAGLPVVEGKALLYKDMAGVDALPMAIAQLPVDEFVDTVANIADSFAGIHLEDIAAPRCFEIEDKLARRLDIPVYHDDQEGTAIVVLAALMNAAKVVGKEFSQLKLVINGAGASGIATAKLLHAAGLSRILLVDKEGLVTAQDEGYNPYQRAEADNPDGLPARSPLSEVIEGCDAFIGLSVADALTPEDIGRMNQRPIVFALSNPKPEIDPQLLGGTDTAVFATGSSQYPNQVNNVLAYPGLFKGLLRAGVKRVSLDLEVAAARSLAQLVAQPRADKVIPGVFDPGVVDAVCAAVENFAREHTIRTKEQAE